MKTLDIMQIIYMLTAGVLLIMSTYRYYIQESYCKELKKRLDEVYKDNDILSIYVLTIALNEYVKKEQYEEANKINDLIVKIKQNG